MPHRDHKSHAPRGILLVRKPRGMSSFDVIRALREKLKIRKMGHAGTLDPLAEGLMMIGIGQGTKLLSQFSDLEKTYRVEVRFGVQTDTGDAEGKVVAEQSITRELTRHDINEVLEELKGVTELPVPRYSAVKQDGVPLYKRARRGESFEPPLRRMIVKEINLLDVRKEGEHVLLSVRMRVGSGVYVRSIAEEIGRRLSLPATVDSLVRESIGDYTSEDAYQIDDIDTTLV